MREKPTILVVDDEPLILQGISDTLGSDYRVICAPSGAAGLVELAAEQKVSVILCDQRMPKMAGDEFLAQARTLSRAARVLITGYADLGAVVRAVNEGQIHSYLTKPFDVDQLRLVVHAAQQAFEVAAQLQVERDLLHGLMDCMPDFIAFKDREGRFIRVNRALAKALGFDSPEQAVGLRESVYVPVEEAIDIQDGEQRLIDEDEKVFHDLRHEILPSGDERWWSRITVPITDASGIIGALVSIKRDISEEKRTERRMAEQEDRRQELEEANRRISYAAAHDPLTGLANRILLEDRMSQLEAQARRQDIAVALLYIDLDGFKTVNDTLGHEAGDEVLKQVARLILPCLRETDTAARLGGDEFVVIGEVDSAAPHAGARHIAARILHSINGGLAETARGIPVGCSIGAAVFPADGSDFAQVMRLADRAMYDAKSQGKNIVILSNALRV